MYTPQSFECRDIDKILSLVASHPFATVISVIDGSPIVSHLPLIADRQGETLALFGHMAKANPHADSLEEQEVYVIFHGPHAYISPTWYAQNDAPTWNYAVAHMRGKARVIRDFNETVGCLRKLSEHVEAPAPNGWRFWVPDVLATPQNLGSAIVAFEIKVSSVEAKFKLNQNRSLMDRAGVVCSLARSILRPDDGILAQMAATFSEEAINQIGRRRLPVQVLVIPFRRQGARVQYAVLRRSNDESWQFISGGVEIGETPMEAAKREVREEAGLEPAEFIQLNSVCSVPAHVFKEWRSWPNATDVVSELSFAVEVLDPRFTLSDEHNELRWCDYDEACRLLKWDSNRTALWELSQRLKRFGRKAEETSGFRASGGQ